MVQLYSKKLLTPHIAFQAVWACVDNIDHPGAVYAATASLLLAVLTLPLTQSRAH